MLTVNLEKELSRQSVSKVNASELLLINEYDRLGSDVANNEILDRVGVNNAVIEGKRLSDQKNDYLKQAQRFNLDKVYHISQIEKVCKKYRLRFLPSAMFKGNIDPVLVDKISTFEITYGVQCKSVIADRWDRYDKERGNNTFIAAPASSFALQEKPKDPLFFYKINEEYYYLIHKWGNDLSLFRRIGNLLEKRALLWIPVICCFIFSISNIHVEGGKISGTAWIYMVLIAGSVLYSIMSFIEGGGGFRLIKKNEITSRYL